MVTRVRKVLNAPEPAGREESDFSVQSLFSVLLLFSDQFLTTETGRSERLHREEHVERLLVQTC